MDSNIILKSKCCGKTMKGKDCHFIAKVIIDSANYCIYHDPNIIIKYTD